MSSELLDLPVSSLSEMIARREISSLDIVDACLAEIAERDDVVKAWVHVAPELAREQARRLDSEVPRSKLHGIPIGVKDVIDTADMPTERGTPIHAHRQPSDDATCISRLRERGAIILGKTRTTEYATWTPGATTNPHNAAHTPGGSSSGSAAAVGARMVPLALGTQTVGSTIRPAAFCGVAGMKPSFGFVPMAGVNLTSQRLDTIGLFGRGVDDVALLLDQLSPTGTEATEETFPGRVLLVESPWWDRADEHTREALRTAGSRLAEAGVLVEERQLPSGFADVPGMQNLMAHFDIANNLRHDYVLHSDQFSENLAARMAEGLDIGLPAYVSALRAAEQFKVELARMLGDGDVLMMPATTGLAPKGIDWTGDPTFCQPWSLFGNPSMTVPVAWEQSTGLPVGVQIVARVGADQLVLAVAKMLEDALT